MSENKNIETLIKILKIAKMQLADANVGNPENCIDDSILTTTFLVKVLEMVLDGKA